jgi:peptide/nickel transport system substrate-binding protein
MTTNKWTRRSFLAATSGIATAAVGVSWTTVGAQDKRALNVRMLDDLSVLDPGYMVGGVEIDVQTATMPSLIEYVIEGGRLGWRKTPFTKDIVQTDDLHIDFTLNPGFVWSNGYGELGAEDVKFTYERFRGTDWSGNWEALERVDVKDKLSGTLVLKQPFVPIWLNTLCGGTGTIMCKAATEAAGGKYTTQIPATCGPYVYQWTPKQRTVFTRNPEWTGPQPDFDEINYILVEEDQAAELAYEAGEVDMTKVTPLTAARYSTTPPENTKMRAAGALQYMWLGMNTEHPKLTDIRVRQAIQHAVDVDSIIAGAYSGIAERSYGIVSPGLPGKRDAGKIDFNPEKSKALLAEAGVSGLELELKTLNVQERLLASQIIQANLAAVGITAKVIPVDSGPFWEMGQESKGEQWKDLQIWLMRFGSGPDPFEPFQWFRKDQIGVWNWERWSSDEFEDLYQKGLAESDVEKRAQIYLRMQEIMEDTAAYVFISHEPETFVHRTSFEPDIWPTAQVNFRNFKAV